MNILFDVTEAIESPDKTGIQRVVVNFAKALFIKSTQSSSFDVRLVSVGDSGRIYERFISELDASLPQESSDIVLFKPLALARQFRKHLESSGFSWVLKSRFIDRIAAYLYRANLDKSLNQLRSPLKLEEIQKSIVFFSADSFWNRSDEQLKSIEKLKLQGVKFVLFIHDIIPLLYPEFVNEGFSNRFKRNLEFLADNADALFFVSDSARSDFVQTYPNFLEKHTRVIYPGFDHVSKELAKTPAKSKLGPTNLIAIGTIDRRKNYGLLLRWFERYGHEYNLTIIGRSNGSVPEITKKLRKFTDLYANFYWHEDADDFILQRELHKAHIGISASMAEGFGLPTLEFIDAGCKVVLSDIPVYREVAGHNATFFDPLSIESLNEALAAAQVSDFVRSRNRFSENSWSNAAENLLTGLAENFK